MKQELVRGGRAIVEEVSDEVLADEGDLVLISTKREFKPK